MRTRGFSLVELLIVVALAAVLASLAAPSFTNFVAAQKLKTSGFDLYSSMMYARSEAIKRRSTVYVRAKDAASWGSGWDITADAAGSTILRSQGALNGLSMEVTPAGTLAFSYGMDGRVSNNNLVATLTPLVNPASVGLRCMNFDAVGTPMIYKPSGATC